MTGAINGANLTFTLPFHYEPGSVAVFLNGVLLKRNDGTDPWTETNPAAGEVVLLGADYVPRPGDSLFAFASRFGESIAENLIVGEIYGVVEAESEIIATLRDESLTAILGCEP